MKIGLPRALLFHHYGDCWDSFLDSIGIEPVISASTTGDVVVSGAVHADNETCLPVKVFTGHLLELREKVDALLVPRVISQYRGTRACPKYLGLPDMARAISPELPPILSPVMDLADGRRRWSDDWYRMARDLGATGRAATRAVSLMLGGLRALELPAASPEPGGFPVGVAGHLYNVYDERVSLGLLDRVRRMGAEPVTVEQVARRQIRKQLKTLDRKIRWDFENRIVGAVLHWSRTASVAGVVYVNSFACGPGSMIGALIEDEFARARSVPLMSVTLDEHSAEAGLLTRIEAFLDMLKRSSNARQPAGPRTGGGR